MSIYKPVNLNLHLTSLVFSVIKMAALEYSSLIKALESFTSAQQRLHVCVCVCVIHSLL